MSRIPMILIAVLIAVFGLIGAETKPAYAKPSKVQGMDAGDYALAIEEIKNLKARYIHGVNLQDRVLLKRVFAPDVIVDWTASHDLDTTATKRVYYGAKISTDAIVDIMIESLKDLSVRRGGKLEFDFVGNPEVEITSPTTARAIWPCICAEGFFYYHETYERIGGEWKIKTLRYIANVEGTPARIENLAMPGK